MVRFGVTTTVAVGWGAESGRRHVEEEVETDWDERYGIKSELIALANKPAWSTSRSYPLTDATGTSSPMSLLLFFNCRIHVFLRAFKITIAFARYVLL